MNKITSTNSDIKIEFLDNEDRVMYLTDYSFTTDWGKLADNACKGSNLLSLYAHIGIHGEDLNTWGFVVDIRQIGY